MGTLHPRYANQPVPTSTPSSSCAALGVPAPPLQIQIPEPTSPWSCPLLCDLWASPGDTLQLVVSFLPFLIRHLSGQEYLLPDPPSLSAHAAGSLHPQRRPPHVRALDSVTKNKELRASLKESRWLHHDGEQPVPESLCTRTLAGLAGVPPPW